MSTPAVRRNPLKAFWSIVRTRGTVMCHFCGDVEPESEFFRRTAGRFGPKARRFFPRVLREGERYVKQGDTYRCANCAPQPLRCLLEPCGVSPSSCGFTYCPRRAEC